MEIGGLEGTDEFVWLSDLPNLESLTIIDNTGTLQCEWLDQLLSKVPEGMNDLTIESPGESKLDFRSFTSLTLRIFMTLPRIAALPDQIRIEID